MKMLTAEEWERLQYLVKVLGRFMNDNESVYDSIVYDEAE